MKIAYVIGRFQPFHDGHKALIDKALEIADRVVVVIGDTGCASDFRNPWTVQERADMIGATYGATAPLKISFVAVEDVPYDDEAWKRNLKEAVAPYTALWSERFLVGHKKDDSSFYLDMFPEWQFVEVEPVMNIHVAVPAVIDGTEIRRSFFGLTGGPWNWKYHVSQEVELLMRRYANRGDGRYARIRAELAELNKHHMDWQCAGAKKFGVTHTTVDTLLEAPESILLVRRKGAIGNGALALPGGFVEPHERLFDAALRELHEEAGINLNPKRKPLIPFDHPKRSMNGRIVTNVLHIQSNREDPPKPGDDAAEAFWVHKEDLPKLKRQFFADHYHIIQHFIKEAA